MAKMARNEAGKPIAGALARHAVAHISRGAPLDANALGVGLFVRSWLRYARERPESIADLSALARVPAGDCDDMVVAIAALLFRLDYPWPMQWFGLGWKNGQAVHIWNIVALRDRPGRIALDASTFKVPMGQSPARFFDRVTVYPLGAPP
jgi:hypothetical protein